MTDVLELPFDQYQRYELVRALVESVRRDGESLRILDVGGRTALLRSFLPSDRVDLVDIDPSDAEGLVLASGSELPFASDSFDVVCCFDTLEHVPPPMRYAFVSECARVAKRYAILAGPYDATDVAEAEQTLLEFLQVRLGWEHRYLAEHRENGLPSLEATQRALEAAGASVAAIGHGRLDRWLLLMALELYIEHEGLLGDFAKKLYRLYNEHIFRTDHGGRVYRHAVVAAFDGAPMPSVESALDPAGSEPREATQALVDASREVLRYDALRDTFTPEMERLHVVVAGVQKDLDGHRRTISTLEKDLEGHRRTVEALRSEIVSEREESRKIQRAKDDEITAKAEVIDELEKLRSAELEELELRAERLDYANRLLNDQNEQLVRMNEQVSAASERLEAADERLESREELVVQLRGELDAALADSVRLRENNAALAEEANRFWSRIGRALTFRRLDPSLTDEG
ncbi:MAG: methyltransferase domain-containing protein [Planctomycetota bacterium]